ncbi:hypothetical protein KQI84_13355 [bacterium]|nr:hypothetical protein [bacterium]
MFVTPSRAERRVRSVLLLCLLISLVSFVAAAPFTYQGYLKDGTSPANGDYDLSFTPFDAETEGTATASSVFVSAVPVTNGVFTVSIDFPRSTWEGAAPWLEVSVRATSVGGAFTTLSPRQQLLAAPIADLSRDSLALDGMASSEFASTIHLHTVGDISNMPYISESPFAYAIPQGGDDAKLDPGWIPNANQVVADFTSGDVVFNNAPVGLLSDKVVHQVLEYHILHTAASPPAIDTAIAALDSRHALLAYRDDNDNFIGKVAYVTIDNEGITIGEPVAFTTETATNLRMAVLDNSRFVISYTDAGSSSSGSVVGGSAFGGVIEFGLNVEFDPEVVTDHGIFSVGGNEFCIPFRNALNGFGELIIGTLDESSLAITLGTKNTYNSPSITAWASATMLTPTRLVIVYSENSNIGVHMMNLDRDNLAAYPQIYMNLGDIPVSATWVKPRSSDEFVLVARTTDATPKTRIYLIQTNNSAFTTLNFSDKSWNTFGFDLDPSGEMFFALYSGEQQIFDVAKYVGSEFAVGYGTVGTPTSSFLGRAVAMGRYGMIAVDYNDSASTIKWGLRPTPLGVASNSANAAGMPVSVVVQGIASGLSGLVPGETYYVTASGARTPERSVSRLGTALSSTQLLMEVER